MFLAGCKRCAINYYEVAISGSNLGALTYAHESYIEKFTEVEVLLRGKAKKAYVLSVVDKPSFKAISITTVHDRCLSQQQMSIATFIASYYICALGEALALYTPFENEKIEQKELELKPLEMNLSTEQEEAYSFIQANPISLLFGDTGSGKTEIYIRFFYDVLQKGGRAFFLMPEISLTPQMQQRLEAHFGSLVAIWHSKITKKRKAAILEGMRTGEVRIIAGPRSILFLPVENLELIIVDEEHDDSYKSGQKPRYHARDIAILMATKQKIPLLLGSATPSLASYVKIPHVRLKGGFYNSKRTIVFEAQKESLSPYMIGELTKNYTDKKQSLAFLPTRANFKYLVCASCGDTVHCPYCSVGMSIHSKKSLIQCHYCNFTEPIPKVCSKCSHNELYFSRLGTAEVVDQLKTKFPNQVIQLFDRDAIKTDTALKKILKAFNNREIDTLVGTQMLSKGHDYHDITLGLILGIDNILSQSDFRAREKALSLLIQIIGRSGRKEQAKVIVQSFNENFFAPYLDKYENFLEEEKSFREGYYPPFTKLARILFAHTKDSTAHDAMQAMLASLAKYDQVEVVGAGKAGIEKIANKYRYTILLRSVASKPLLQAIKATLHPLAQVDIDPIDFV
jgi:primosomal protein N' (replication factor Y) (superfamily II helicase)